MRTRPMTRTACNSPVAGLDNYGVILGTDDGIDVDEGVIHNHAGGVIVSTGPEVTLSTAAAASTWTRPSADRGGRPPAGPLTIINEGYIEGVRAIGTDDDSTAEITIENSGTLRGRSGTAIELAPGRATAA